MAKKYTKAEIEGMITNLEEKEKKARSKWGKAVLQDAQWLLDNVIEGYDEPYELNEKLVLNGASDWKQFSYDGNSLVYDAEVAEHYSTPSELKKVGFDKENMCVEKQPNDREEWLDVQARALRQAWWAIRDEMNGTTEFSMSLCEFSIVDDSKKMAKKYTKAEIEGMITNLEEKEKKARSKWGKAVLQDAQWLLDNVIEGYDEPYELNEKLVLNGASDWKQFSYDGNSLVYDAEVAEHYSTPSELKKVGFDKENMCVEKQPNDREEWLDVQARALRQAWWAIRDEMNGTTEFSIVDDTTDVIKAAGKLAKNVVDNTTSKGGLLMF